jgi:uncharacterized protein (DUF2384 family)
MPRIKAMADKYQVDDLRRLIKYLMADTPKEVLSDGVGLSTRTLHNRKEDPESFTVGEIRKLCRCVHMDADDKEKLRRLIVP